MLKILEKQKYPVVVLFLGFLLILIGIADIQELQKLKLVARQSPIYVPIVIGTMLTIFSFVSHAFEEISLGWSNFGGVEKTNNGFRIVIGNTTINLIYGRLEEVASEFPDSAVVLPANEFFDDECIDDNKSALGAYINNKFINQTEEIKQLIKTELNGQNTTQVEKEKGIFKDSYGVGKALLVRNALGSPQPIVFLAVTTKRAGEGIKSELSYLHLSVKQLFEATADGRIDTFYLPILGSGHGGLTKEVALFGLLMALIERLKSQNGKHIRLINIVVFKAHGTSVPEVSKSKAKRPLSMASGMLHK